MGSHLASIKKSFFQNVDRLEAKTSLVQEALKEPADLSLDAMMQGNVLARLDQMVRDLQKALLDARQEVIRTRQDLAIESYAEAHQNELLEIIQKYEELEKQVRRSEERMLIVIKERFAILQEIGERQHEYVHQIRASLEEDWTDLIEAPSRDMAFQMRVRISKTIQKFEEAECIWYQIIDKRLLFLKNCKKTSYFPQLLREASYFNDLAMRSTEFCEAFRANLEELKILPGLCDEFFMIEEEVAKLEERQQDMSPVELKQELFWMEKGLINCQFHSSSKREFHKRCQILIDKVRGLQETL